MRTPEFPKEVTRDSVTVTIYQTPTKGYEGYTLSYYENGKRKRETSADYGAIRSRADEVLEDLTNGRPTEVGSIRAADRTEFVRAKQAAIPLKKPVDVIVRHYAHAVKLLGEDLVIEACRDYARRHPVKMPRKTVAEVVTEFLAEKEKQQRSPRHLETLRSHCNRLAEACKQHISTVTATDIDAFLDGLDVGPRTRDNVADSIRNVFEFAKRKRYLPSDHDETDRITRMEHDEDGPIEIYTPDELTKLLKHAKAELVPFIVIGAFAGLRSSEVLRLNWEDVKCDSDCIIVQKGKVKKRGKSRRVVPMLPNLKAWVERVGQKEGAVWKHGKAYLYELLAGVATKAGVQIKHNALRHSFVSYRSASIKNVPQVAYESGNSPQIIDSNYRELVTDKDAEAWFSVLPPKRKAAKKAKS